MFDIGAGEVLVLLLAALFVFGPDRLPTIARQAGRWVNDLRQMVANARRDLTDGLGVDEKDLSSLRDLDPRRYVRQNVLDGLDLDDEPKPRRSPSDAPRNGTPRGPGAAGPTPAAGEPAAQPVRPPYDPDAT
ncbi:MAG TPA: sec-independent translocase [Jiangellales bacterium]|nr:sec-independent translocase [Jiangellales bacterium]